MSGKYHLPIMRNNTTRYSDTEKDRFDFEDRFLKVETGQRKFQLVECEWCLSKHGC